MSWIELFEVNAFMNAFIECIQVNEFIPALAEMYIFWGMGQILQMEMPELRVVDKHCVSLTYDYTENTKKGWLTDGWRTGLMT